ncbi:hypothetical protein SUGI_0129790 [Cryptomeria japonica]|nr:hypothetical protein SUGI_0129790 [Cryptomeria japonica]
MCKAVTPIQEFEAIHDTAKNQGNISPLSALIPVSIICSSFHTFHMQQFKATHVADLISHSACNPPRISPSRAAFTLLNYPRMENSFTAFHPQSFKPAAQLLIVAHTYNKEQTAKPNDNPRPNINLIRKLPSIWLCPIAMAL